ncbi:MAG: Ig-like domain-containing protein, partial [Paludibacter sp.]
GTPASVTGAAVATTFSTIQAPYKAIRIKFDAYIPNDGKSILITLGSANKTLNSGTTILINKWQVQGLTNMDYSKAVMLSSASTIYQFDVVKPNSLNSIQIDVSESGSIVVTVNGYTCTTTYQADLTSLSGQFALLTTEFSPFQLKNLQVTKAANTKEWFYDFRSIPVNLVSFANSTLSVPETDNIQLVPEILPTNATNKNVKWFTDNDQIATVNENGIVTGIKIGSTKITAVSDDGNLAGTCMVNVTANGQQSAPQVLDLLVNNGDYFSPNRIVPIVSYAKGLPTEYCIASNESFSGSVWKTYKSKDTYELLNVTGKQTIYFKVKNSLGESAVKAVELIYKPAPTKLDATNRTHPARITVSPNPVQGLARIKIESDVNLNGNVALADEEQYILTITTLSGIVIQSETSFGNNFVMDLSSLKTGTYLLKVQGEFKAFTSKILKENNE